MSQDLLSWDPFAPVSQTQTTQATQIVSSGQDDDDEFGDFEEAPSAAPPVPSVAPSASTGGMVAKPLASKKKPTIQDSISKMGNLEPNQSIRFGQHLNKGSKTSADWNGILDARPGDRNGTKPKPMMQPASQVAQPSADLFEWDEIESIPPSISITFSPVFKQIPTPHQLLVYLHTDCLPIMDKLLKQLQPLTFSLRKRVLAHPTTKNFVERYIDLVYLAARVMAGRKRKLRIIKEIEPDRMSDEEFSGLMRKSDRDARELERVWKPLSASIGPITNHRQLPMLQPDFIISNSEEVPKDLSSICVICGLKNTEFIRGHPKPKFNSKQNAHCSCINWYNNLSVFGIRGVRGISTPVFSGDLI